MTDSSDSGTDRFCTQCGWDGETNKQSCPACGSDWPADQDDEPMKVGSTKTLRVGVLMEYTVEVDVPPQADLSDQAGHELFLLDQWGDYNERDVLNVDVLDEQPLWEDDFESSEGWPSYV